MKWKSNRRPTVNKSGKRTIWKYAQADFAKASSVIDETNWDLVLTSDVNEPLIKEITSKKEKSSIDDKKFDESNREEKWFLLACKAKWKPVTF